MNLLLLGPDSVDAKGRAVLTPEQSAHVQSVLRAEPGDRLRVGLMNGPKGTGRVVAIEPERVELECVFDPEPPPRPCVDLLLALPRPKVMKRLWAQLAALGVGRIMLTNAARVERNYFDTHVIDPDFFTPLLIEGLQQAQDTRLPRVTVHRRLKPLIEDELAELSDASDRIILHPGAPAPLLKATPADPAARALLAVGPEGGWVLFELELLAAHGFRPVHMGARTLRTDTACVAALALLQAAFDFGGQMRE